MKQYVQIGANVGQDDFFRKLQGIEEPGTVHLIEPNTTLHSQLLRCYLGATQHTVHVHGFGIAPTTGEQTLYLYNNSGLSSLLNRRSHQYLAGEMLVSCITFNEFCRQHDIGDIEYLSIDTEGLDYEILNSIDLEAVDIKEIVFEVWPHIADDLNGRYLTGEAYLNDVVLRRYVDYVRSETVLDGIRSYVLNREGFNRPCR